MFYDVLLGGRLEWDIPWLVGLICVAILYIGLVKYFANGKKIHKQPILFFLGLALTYLALGSPVAPISHLSFSLHMIQMSVIYFIIPPLLLLGTPTLLFRRIRKIPLLRKVIKYLPLPTVALYTFAGLFLMYHLPVVLKVISQDPFLHITYSIFLFVLALLMWWPIAAPNSKQRFPKEQKKRYVLLSGLLLTPACLLFIINGFMNGMDNPFLNEITAALCVPSSADSFTILPAPFNTKYDQIAAGFFMMAMHKFGLMLTVKLGSGTIG